MRTREAISDVGRGMVGYVGTKVMERAAMKLYLQQVGPPARGTTGADASPRLLDLFALTNKISL